MKKIISLTLSVLISIFALSACMGMNDDAVPNGSNAPAESSTPSNMPDGNDPGGDVKDEAHDIVDDAKDVTKETEDDVSKNAKNTLPKLSSNTSLVDEKNAPDIFIIDGANNAGDSVTYHLKGCKDLNNKKTTKISWEMAQMIGFWQCPVCNPPRYEGYKNAN